MKIAACHVSVKGTKYYCITCDRQFATCAQSSKGMEKQAVGKQENVLLFESPLIKMTGFTTF